MQKLYVKLYVLSIFGRFWKILIVQNIRLELLNFDVYKVLDKKSIHIGFGMTLVRFFFLYKSYPIKYTYQHIATANNLNRIEWNISSRIKYVHRAKSLDIRVFLVGLQAICYKITRNKITILHTHTCVVYSLFLIPYKSVARNANGYTQSHTHPECIWKIILNFKSFVCCISWNKWPTSIL